MMIRRLGFLLLVAWAILSIGALAQFLHASASEANGELEVLLAWYLLILNFPLSLVAELIAPAGPIAQWCLFSFIGFVQWGLLVPVLVSRLRTIAAREKAPRVGRLLLAVFFLMATASAAGYLNVLKPPAREPAPWAAPQPARLPILP